MSSNGWTKNIERLLKNWSKQISINEDEYRKRGTCYRRWYYAFGAFIAIGQTGALVAVVNTIISLSTTAKTNEANFGLLIFVAIMDALVLIAQGLDKFFNFGSGSEQFYEASKEHNALSRLIDATLTLPRVDRDLAREVLLSIRQQFNHIQDNSPNLPPNAVVHQLDMIIYKDPSQAKGRQGSSTNPSSGTEESVPETAITVNLPESSTEDKTQDSTEEHVSTVQKCKFNAQIQEQKGEAAREHQSRRTFRNLEYQWNRMEQHGEDDPEDIV